MTFVTLTYNGVEKSLADWGFSSFIREWHNQGSDTCGGDLSTVAADGVDPFPYRAFVTIRIGRTLPAISFTPAGAPLPNQQGYAGGKVIFCGYRMRTVRTASPEMESLKYKFGSVWDFYLEATTFRQLWVSWNGVQQAFDWRDNVDLGLSPQVLTGINDQVPNTVATNLLTITQQIKQIIAYAAMVSAADQALFPGAGGFAGPQLQSDALTVDANGNYVLVPAVVAGQAITIPDFVPGQSPIDLALTPNGQWTSLVPGGMMLRAPVDAANNISCAEALRRMCRWVGALGEPVLWFDYTTTPPTLHINTVDQMPAVNLPYASGQANSDITECEDLILPCVSYRFNIQGTLNGAGYTEVIHDTAAMINGVLVEGWGINGRLTTLAGGALPVSQAVMQQYELLSRVQTGSFDFLGVQTSQQQATVSCSPLVTLDVNNNPVSGVTVDPAGSVTSAAAAFWIELFPELARAQAGTLKFANAGNPAPFLTIQADGNTSTTGQITDSSSGLPLTYISRFLDGVIAPWMQTQANIAASVIEATITVFFSYTEQSTPQAGGAPIPGKTFSKKELNATIKITNLSNGTYYSNPTAIAGEFVPLGLAGFILALAQIPKFQGSFTIQETEVTDAVPPGNNFNFTGTAQAALAAMAATPQSINYDFTRGTTRLNFGVPQHLGSGEIVERQKVNHGPRWVNEIGDNMVNTKGANSPNVMGQNVPKHSASPGVALGPTVSYPSNVVDAEQFTNPVTGLYGAGANAGVNAGLYPGVHADAKPNGTPQQALPAAGQGPGLIVASGAAGGITNFCRVSLAEVTSIVNALNAANPGLNLAGLMPVVFRAVPCVETYQGAVCTPGYRIVLAGAFIPAAVAPAGLAFN